MKNKYKITGFARLLIFMIFFAPIAYLGVSYYQGEDGIEKIKSIYNGQSKESIETQISKKKKEIQELEIKLKATQEDLSRLEKEAD